MIEENLLDDNQCDKGSRESKIESYNFFRSKGFDKETAIDYAMKLNNLSKVESYNFFRSGGFDKEKSIDYATKLDNPSKLKAYKILCNEMYSREEESLSYAVKFDNPSKVGALEIYKGSYILQIKAVSSKYNTRPEIKIEDVIEKSIKIDTELKLSILDLLNRDDKVKIDEVLELKTVEKLEVFKDLISKGFAFSNAINYASKVDSSQKLEVYQQFTSEGLSEADSIDAFASEEVSECIANVLDANYTECLGLIDPVELPF
jgi:hypothetical protein